MSRENPLRERVAEAIRADVIDLGGQPWDRLPFEKKVGWLGDADRALAVIVEEVVRVVTERDPNDPTKWRHERVELSAALRFALSPISHNDKS